MKGISPFASLLKRIYGAKSEKMSHEQLLLELLGDDAKKPEAAAPEDQGSAAESQDQNEPKCATMKAIHNGLFCAFSNTITGRSPAIKCSLMKLFG